MPDAVVYHFSEDPSIRRFVPHVPRTNPSQPPAVWAIDAEHAPLYWFPRDCPRVAVWPRTPAEATRFQNSFRTVAPRLHAAELRWMERIRSARLYRYEFEATLFSPWAKANGQWIAEVPLEPLAVTALGDLIDAHIVAGIELRFVPELWTIRDKVVQGPWDFSAVRMANARRRRDQPHAEG